MAFRDFQETGPRSSVEVEKFVQCLTVSNNLYSRKDIQSSLQILISAKNFALHSLGELKRSSHLIKLNFKVTPTSYL